MLNPSTEATNELTYNPNKLLDAIIDKLNVKSDAALCRVLDVGPPFISKIRNRKLPIGPTMLLRMHEVSGFSLAEMRTISGDRRKNFRLSDAKFKRTSDSSSSQQH